MLTVLYVIKMKILLIILLTLTFSFVASGQSLTKEEKKAQKEREKLQKQIEKEKLKRPAQKSIVAPIDKVTPLLIRVFQTWNYQLDDESPRRLLLSKEVPGIGNKILAGMAVGGSNQRYQIQVTLTEVSGVTDILVNI